MKPYPRLLAGLNLIAFAAWNIGTWGGLFFVTAVPPAPAGRHGDSPLYVYWVARTILPVRKTRLGGILAGDRIPYGIAFFAMDPITFYWLTIIIATMFAAALGVLFPRGAGRCLSSA